MSLIGAKPRPRVLLLECPDAMVDGLSSRLASFIPTLQSVSYAELEQMRLAEWDAAVAWRLGSSLPAHMHVLSIAPDRLATIGKQMGWIREARYDGTSYATEYIVADEVPREVARLVRSDLLALLAGEPQHRCVWLSTLQSTGGEAPSFDISPFVSDGDGKVLAGSLIRPGSDAQFWFLPDGADVAGWIEVAVDVWGKTDTERFPDPHPWRSRTEWQGPAEIAAAAREAASLASFEAAQATRDRESREIRDAASAAAAATDAGPRRLLTAQGDDLVEAVADCLTGFGFTSVEQMDAAKGAADAKLEDLRVSDADGWLGLVEVRGYTGGAKSNDLLRLARFVARYLEEAGERPSAVWYVVNQMLDQDPDRRPAPLAGVPDDVDEFALGDGAVIDTRELFRAWRTVALGESSNEQVRDSLKTARGVWRWTTDPSGEDPTSPAAK